MKERKKKNPWQVREEKVVQLLLLLQIGGGSRHDDLRFNHQELLVGNRHGGQMSCIFQDEAFPQLQSVLDRVCLPGLGLQALRSV